MPSKLVYSLALSFFKVLASRLTFIDKLLIILRLGLVKPRFARFHHFVENKSIDIVNTPHENKSEALTRDAQNSLPYAQV